MSEKIDLTQVNFSTTKKIIYRNIPSISDSQCQSWWLKLKILKTNIKRKLVGQHEMLDCLLMGLITGGHVLLQGPPGLGKSTAIHSLCELLECSISIVEKSEDFMGANLVIVDELNRCEEPLRRSLLTAMQEKEIVVDNQHYYLDLPFVVFSTVNPTESGRFPLLKAELDRFMLHYSVDPPEPEQELEILNRHLGKQEVFEKAIDYVFDATDILELQRLVRTVHIEPSLRQKMVQTIAWVRKQKIDTKWHGFSPRTTINWAHVACARAFLNERINVEIQDLTDVLGFVFSHRLPVPLQTTPLGSNFLVEMRNQMTS